MQKDFNTALYSNLNLHEHLGVQLSRKTDNECSILKPQQMD